MASLGRALLAQAHMLAKREPKKPQQASLRRSISASYYAVFHFLVEESTKLAAGSSPRRQNLRQLAARAFNHGKMRSVCGEFLRVRPQSPALQVLWVQFQPHLNADLQWIARVFVQLQEDRHDADYNLSRTFVRNEALLAFSRAEGAFYAWDRLKNHDPELAFFFALSLLIWPGLGGR